MVRLHNYCQDCNDDREQSDTLNQYARNQHIRTNVIGRFRLTRNGFNGGTTDFTDTDTGSDGCDTSAKSGTQFGESCEGSCTSGSLKKDGR
jgi:hypothetical protein